MIHIVFNLQEIKLIKEVIELDESLKGSVLAIRDDYAVGILKGLDTEEGWQDRLAWWKDLLMGSPYENDPVVQFDDRETVKEIKASLENEPEQQLWIWAGQNQHDVCGYYWLVSQLKNFQGRIMIIYLNNLPFINEKGQLFYPTRLQEILPKELLKAKKLSRPVTLSEFELDTDEWKRICEENVLVRLLEGGKKIVGKEETVFDAELLKSVSGEWQKSTKVLSNTLHRMKVKTGDVFLMWRLKQLIALGKIEVLGKTDEGWKAFDVRKTGSTVENNIKSENSIGE